MDRSTLSVIEQLEASMSSVYPNESTVTALTIDETVFNDLRNATIDYEDTISCSDYQEEAWSSDSDSEYIPRICVRLRLRFLSSMLFNRTGGAFETQLNLDDICEINMEDTLYDFEDMEEEEKEEETTTDASPSTFLMKVICEDDIIGVPASIVYHSSLKQLVQYLDIPTRACTAMDRTTKQRCGAPKPFEVVVWERGTAAVVEWDMWVGLLHHVTGEHSWALGSCHHGPLVEPREKDWIEPNSEAPQKLSELILDARWLKDVPKYLHFRSAKLYSKRSRRWRLYSVKDKKDYSYITELQVDIVRKRLASAALPVKTTRRPGDPRRLGTLSGVSAPSTEELLRTQHTRGIGHPEAPE
ncbi:unnamed protein product [Leuciscus chuanchicus]